MSYPTPVPGLVIRFSFLWSTEAKSGVEEGRKDRPCAIVVAVPKAKQGKRGLLWFQLLTLPHQNRTRRLNCRIP